MRVGSITRRGSGIIPIVFALLVIGTLLGGCGGDKTSTSTSAPAVASSGTTAASAESSTASSSGVTTTVGAATTAGVTTTTAAVTTTSAVSTTATAQSTTTTAKATTTTAKSTTTTARAKVALTVSGPSGTEELSMADLKAMPATSGWGGWKNQLGNITAPMSWTGVSVRALIDLVGGSGSVTVVASDGYEQAFSGGELSGSLAMYDPATGEAVTGISGSLRAILAYAKGGSAIGSSDGPLRIAFVSPEKDQVTDGSSWVKLVVKLKVN
jgi:DMSO/TMAO reductase YedYZ molybdopterin-dependent catalytic subunit